MSYLHDDDCDCESCDEQRDTVIAWWREELGSCEIVIDVYQQGPCPGEETTCSEPL